MSGRFRRAWLFRQALRAAWSAHRHVAASLAILALYVQIAAAGLCTAGLPSLDPAAGLSAFPICHSQSGGAAPTQGDHAPAHHHECPFCAVHCHAAMALAPSVSGLDSFQAISTPVEPALFIIPHAARFRAGAPPRGPPASA